ESAALPGQDEVYNDWYEKVHIGDVLAVPGFRSCRRYRIVDPTDTRPRYMAAYEVECDDPHALLQDLMARAKSMVLSPSLDGASMKITILEPGYSAVA